MFADESRARVLAERICAKLNRPVADDLWRLFGGWPNSDDGLARFDRLAGSMTGPGAFADQFTAIPELAANAVGLLCLSQHATDMLIQNPELAGLLLDPDVLSRIRLRDEVEAEGMRMLSHASGYSHQLDRLRYIKQERTLLLAAQDLGGLLPQPEIWRGISELAIGLIRLALRTSWSQFRKRGDFPEQCPVCIGVLGKLGGLELNYSSDIDLVFVVGEGLGEADARKFCELFRSSVADRMGRGDLYRVDLRLRPFGSQGPIANNVGAVEKYYAQYAEPWETMALLRSFAISENPNLESWWAGLREKTVFVGPRTELFLGNVLKMRRRAEAEAADGDIKRGSGGIRDVETVIQVVQTLNGDRHPTLQGRPTVEMLAEAGRLGLMDTSMAGRMADHYTFLRTVEHRVQMVANRQAYALPEDPMAREVISFSLGYPTATALEADIAARRAEVRKDFDAVFSGVEAREPDSGGLDWLENRYLTVVAENPTSRERLRRVSAEAPALVPFFDKAPSILDQTVSGEVEEPVDSRERFAPLRKHYSREEMIRALRSGWLRACVRSVLDPEVPLGDELASHMDAGIEVMALHWGEGCSVIGLGSLASGEVSPSSDADLIVICSESGREVAERGVQASLVEIGRIKAAGAPFAVDFRLRPEGRNGRLAVTSEGLRRYAATFMEPWERFALGRARLVFGDPSGLAAVVETAYGEPLSGDEFESLTHMKDRIERERVKPGLRWRQIKLGSGGIDDIAWLLQLGMLKEADMVARLEAVPLSAADRIKFLVGRGVLDVVEQAVLAEGHEYLSRLRNRLTFLGVGDDVFPENPDKLAALARYFGEDDPNSMLSRHQRTVERIRTVFEEGVARMRVQ